MILAEKLRDDAQAIWQAGVDAVRADLLVGQHVGVDGKMLTVCDQQFRLDQLRQIVVVGAGKAGAGMAAGLEKALGKALLDAKVRGWVNVPEDCVRPLRKIQLHAARPAGVNEPTEAAVQGTQRILQMVSELGPDDLCLVLLSGGGSALLPAPRPPLSLRDKQAVTHFLMHAGATIGQLNTVRKRLSTIKGGGLAAAAGDGRMIALIISDVVGDPLDLIASGPTVSDTTTDGDALDVLRACGAAPPEVPAAVFACLQQGEPAARDTPVVMSQIANHVIGNNAMAVTAAGAAATSLGYHTTSLGSNNCGDADEEGRLLADRCRALRDDPQAPPTCLLSGGEPVVRLAKTDQPRLGGRNQQLVLAGLCHLLRHGDDLRRLVLLSGGTDGEDGPTDAAGAWADADLVARTFAAQVDPWPYLKTNNAYRFFDRVGGLLRTGPTHTNVMDVRVGLVGGTAESRSG